MEAVLSSKACVKGANKLSKNPEKPPASARLYTI